MKLSLNTFLMTLVSWIAVQAIGMADPNCTFTMSPSSGTYPGGGAGQIGIPVTVSGGCSWYASTDSAWLSLYGSSFYLSQNDTGSTRTGTVTAKDVDGNVVGTYTVT